MITTLLTESGIVGMHVDDARSLIWLVRDEGVVLTSDLSGNAEKYQQLAGAQTVLAVALDDGWTWTIDPDDPVNPAVHVAMFSAAPTQLVVSPSGKAILGAVGGAGEWIAVASGAVTPYALPAGTTGVALLTSAVVAATNDPVTAKSRLRRLGGFWLGPASAPVAELGRAGASADGTVAFGASPATNTVIAWEPATATTTTGDAAALPGTVIEVQGLGDGRIVVLTDQVLAIVDTLADLTVSVPPSIVEPSHPLFVASWVRLEYDFGTSGLTAADVTFTVPDGPDAGIVSHTMVDFSTRTSR